jgi:glycosyltransferase involved in cell wall biosynthesis
MKTEVTPNTSGFDSCNRSANGVGKIFFDCTHVFNCSWMNSGIQRVVRNIAKELPPSWRGRECIPVTFESGAFHRIVHLIPDDPVSKGTFAQIVEWLERKRNRLFEMNKRIQSGKAAGMASRTFRCLFHGLCFAWHKCYLALRWPRNSLGFDPFQSRTLPIEIRPNDELVLLDSSWHVKGLSEQVSALKSRGVRIVAIIYDIIPLQYPEFCDDQLVAVFAEWFEWVSKVSDCFVCISRSVLDDIKQEVIARLSKSEADQRSYGYFHLGAELDMKDTSKVSDQRLRDVFASEQPVFIAVSTIEPRKNHGYLLDVFDCLWQEGSSARLCIVGRVGWKCDAFMERAMKHTELGRRFFMFNELDDNGLEYAYCNAKALIFPSLAEGFGLPLVEAMQRGLPAIASDIKVFREVGGDYLSYCNPRDPKTCAAIIREVERTGRLPSAKPLNDWKWISWKESATQLLVATDGDSSVAS